MAKLMIVILLSLMGTANIQAQANFNKSDQSAPAQILQSGASKAWCPVCGMNLKMFYKTNHAMTLADGTIHQYCSLRCLAIDLKQHPLQQKTIQVVDAKTNRFIPAQSAYYVVGSDIPGTMSRQSKLAFASKQAAKSFSLKHKGQRILRFEEALALAQEQLQADNAMLIKKKQTVVLPKGARLFKKFMSSDLQIPAATNIAGLKSWLKTRPGIQTLDEKKLQMLALYIWDTKLHPQTATAAAMASLQVDHQQKCPVCGMYVYKYPRWAAAMEIKTSGDPVSLYFDGVKDLMKFFFEPGKWGNYQTDQTGLIRVTDYYSQQAIDGRQAWYVMGSDILGPMGHELIPFASQTQAQTFLQDHDGTRILSFDDLNLSLINALDH